MFGTRLAHTDSVFESSRESSTRGSWSTGEPTSAGSVTGASVREMAESASAGVNLAAGEDTANKAVGGGCESRKYMHEADHNHLVPIPKKLGRKVWASGDTVDSDREETTVGLLILYPPIRLAEDTTNTLMDSTKKKEK